MLASCLCSACLGGACLGESCLHRHCPEHCSSHSNLNKYYHFIMHSLILCFAFTIAYVCLNPQVSRLLPRIPMIHGSCSETHSLYCYGLNTVYRVSLALSVFYFIHFLLAAVANRFYKDCYILRWIGFLALSALTAIVPGTAIKVYAWSTMPVAALFLIMMIVIWIDFAYEWQQVWSKRNNKIWMSLISAFTVLFTAAWIILLVLQFVFFDCLEARVYSAINLCIGVLCYILPLKLKKVYYLPVSVIVLYNTYVVYEGLNYGIGLDQSCYYRNLTTLNEDNPIGASVVFDTFLTMISLVWTCFSIANSHTLFNLRERDYTSNVFYKEETVSLTDEIWVVGPDPVEKKSDWQYQFFFLVMTMAASYMLMTLSSWQVYGHSIQSRIDSGRTSMYIKIGSTYVCYLLFIFWGVDFRDFANRVFKV